MSISGLPANHRRHLTKSQRLDVHAANSGRCHICNLVINLARERMEVEHVIPIGLGGADDTTNWRPAHVACHARKTKADVATIAKAKRVKAKHDGTWRGPRHIVPGSRAHRLKKKLNGEVIIREEVRHHG